MSIKVYAVQNFLQTCFHPFFIKSYCSAIIEPDELIDVMAEGRTTLSKPDIVGCLKLFEEVVISLVAAGNQVKTSLGAFYLSANGTLESQNQSFTPGRGTLGHNLTLHFRTNKRVEAVIKSRARWERIESFDTSAACIVDVATIEGTKANTATAGSILRLTGRRLRFDATDNSCGLFLESKSGRLRVIVYPDIDTSKVIAVLPSALPRGPYALVLATRPNGKKLKEGYYEKSFTIE